MYQVLLQFLCYIDKILLHLEFHVNITSKILLIILKIIIIIISLKDFMYNFYPAIITYSHAIYIYILLQLLFIRSYIFTHIVN